MGSTSFPSVVKVLMKRSLRLKVKGLLTAMEEDTVGGK